jgi:hypothetical protein
MLEHSMKYIKSNWRWVTDNEMGAMQKLWINGLSVRQINAIFSKYSRDTVRRYVKDVKRLPRKMRKIPFADFKRKPDAITEFSMVLNKEEVITRKKLADLQQWRDMILRFARKSN